MPSERAPSFVVRGQIAELHPQHGGLNAIHASIPANHGMVILFELPMITEHLHLLLQFSIICHYRPSLTKSTQVLARIKAETSSVPNRAGLASFVQRAMGLAGILNHVQAVATGDIHYGIQIRHLPKEMDWNDCLGFLGNRHLEQTRIHRISLLIDINKDRFSPAEAYRFNR